MNQFYSGSISVSGGVNQSLLLFDLAENSIMMASVCVFKWLPKGATRPHVIVERDLNLVARVTGQHLVWIPAKIWLGVFVKGRESLR